MNVELDDVAGSRYAAILDPSEFLLMFDNADRAVAHSARVVTGQRVDNVPPRAPLSRELAWAEVLREELA